MRTASHCIDNRICFDGNLFPILFRYHKIFANFDNFCIYFVFAAVFVDEIMYSCTVQTGCLRHQRTFHFNNRCLYTVIDIICGCLTANQTATEYDGALSKTCKVIAVYVHCCYRIFNSLDWKDQIIGSDCQYNCFRSNFSDEFRCYFTV